MISQRYIKKAMNVTSSRSVIRDLCRDAEAVLSKFDIFRFIRNKMSSIGTGYDLQSSQFSPDGRVFQVEYAQKAVENSGTVIGITAKDGVILAVEKLIDSNLFEDEANRRIFHIDSHIGMTVAGLLADARQIVEVARNEASSFRSTYDRPIPCRVLADRVSMYMHAYTLYSFVRPFGCSIILSSYEEDRPLLFTIEPSGTYHGYYGCAFGKAMQAAKTEIEKLKIKQLSMTQMVTEAAKILYTVHDEVKDKKFELEMSWIGADTNCEHQLIPDAVKQEAASRAKAAIQQESEDDDN